MSQSEQQREEAVAVDSSEVNDSVASQSNVIIRYASAAGVQLAGQISDVLTT